MRDAPAVFRAVDESRVEISRWMDWCRPTYALADAEEWIRSTLRGREDGSSFQFGIFDGRRFLGACGLNHVDEAAGVANLGYWVRTAATGQGGRAGGREARDRVGLREHGHRADRDPRRGRQSPQPTRRREDRRGPRGRAPLASVRVRAAS